MNFGLGYVSVCGLGYGFGVWFCGLCLAAGLSLILGLSSDLCFSLG